MIDSEQEYLTFMLQGEEYGIDILCVQEIRVWSSVTELPNKPSYLKGVINLRGVIIPIIDLRLRFGHQPLDYDDQTVTVILRQQKENRTMVVGLVVDAVSEVYKFEPQSIRPAPAFGSQIDSCFLKGLATAEDKLIILLDSDTLLSEDDLYSIEQQKNTEHESNDAEDNMIAS
ncbi:chemotaxis protein CheW [Litorilituus sediminis]|uniref:Chemotaxis protein CheW n=1 Tax=Litorilituus sediminis TaxID=718192 RepID=A0A4P6P0V0_9GAMM|nr:chemotaxis protein CheW [Litorilituus sediminis]QBG34563.1 purine-binding chemotaxis protein CheW [Litorilituus sediminis]